ncbi:MAG: hypothetical protein ACM3SW_16330 [Actinomycetota bacterium]
MNHTKPQVSLLGEAASVIQTLGIKVKSTETDPATGQPFDFNPAYDLDE